MGEIDGEKPGFREEMPVSERQPPAAPASIPAPVRRRRRSFTRHCARIVFGLAAFVFVSLGLLVAAVETGALDTALTSGARAALSRALPPEYRVEIGSSVLRFSHGLHLAVEARDVTVVTEDGEQVSQTGTVRMALDPGALIAGRISIAEIEASGISLDTAFMSTGGAVDLTQLRLDQIPDALEGGFSGLDDLALFMARSGTDELRLKDLAVALKGGDGVSRWLSVESVSLTRDRGNVLVLDGSIAFEGTRSAFRISAENTGGRVDRLSVSLGAIELAPFMLRHDSAGNVRQGFSGAVKLEARARRGDAATRPELFVELAAQGGTLYFDGRSQELTRMKTSLGYDFMKNTLEILPSQVEFGPMRVPFSGGFIDLDRLDGAGAAGYALDLLVENGWADVPAAGEAPFPFSLKMFGRYRHVNRWLDISELTVRTPSGTMNATLQLDTGNPSPEIIFSGRIDTMQVGMVKQLWPYWMAAKPREWMFENLFGGTVRNAAIDVHIPPGRLTVEPTPLELGRGELALSLDVENARMNIVGDIPPLRDTNAHLNLDGEKLTVTIGGGTSYFGSGRSVAVDGGEIGIASTYAKPLMADVRIAVSGEASAVAELVSFRPIRALERIGFEASDFSGNVTGEARIRLGLVQSQHPPPPAWSASLKLAGLTLAKPFDGRRISDMNAALDIDQRAARLTGTGKIDGAPMDVTLVEPVEQSSDVARARVVRLKLDDKQLGQLVPELAGIIDGSTEIEMTRVDQNRQAVSADLTQATLTVPWIGWTKGKGIGSTLRLALIESDGETRVEGLDLTGEGFGAKGSLTLNKGAISAADFSYLKLSPADDFSLSVRQGKGGYRVDLKGKSADLRSVLGKLKEGGEGKVKGKDAGGDFSGSIEMQLDRAIGFHDEVLSTVTLNYGAVGGKTNRLDMKAVTDAGQAVVAQMRRSGRDSTVTLTTSDAGSIVRFADLYQHMQGGLLNLKLDGRDGAPWSGFADIRNFRLENEQRLQSIVSTPADADGRSLNNAVRRDIDVSSARFQRAFARLIYADETLRLENGILRGEQVGASFQGFVKDQSGNMDMTGTFMPAYGLNRLFAELPVIGILLGNGRDRGLLGITFKLTGPTDKPKLVINPLSIIAPGVFRQIFEFQ